MLQRPWPRGKGVANRTIPALQQSCRRSAMNPLALVMNPAFVFCAGHSSAKIRQVKPRARDGYSQRVSRVQAEEPHARLSAARHVSTDIQFWKCREPWHRLRRTPAVPWLSAFPELNVRTYVTCGGKPGVWFFSLDAANSLAVAIARAWFHLPYFRARMTCAEHEGWIHYQSERIHRGAPAGLLKGRYRPIGDAISPRPGTLEHFLTERYCLNTADAHGQIIRGEIHHPPWPLQRAEAEIVCNSMTESLGIAPTSRPLLHFARRQDVLVWPPRKIA